MADLTSIKTAKEQAAPDSGRFSAEPDQLPVPYGLYGRVLGLQHTAGNQAVSQFLQPITDERAQNAKGVPPNVQDVLQSGGGQPLDPATRAEMEARFGQDFSQVRVHTDAQAAESARDLHAKAYTVRQQLVFSSGAYSPATTVGKHLLTHELTHVIQQSASHLTLPQTGAVSEETVTTPENEARNIATRASEGQAFTISSPVSAGTIQRAPDDETADIYELHFKFSSVELHEKGLNPDQALKFLWRIRSLLFEEMKRGMQRQADIGKREAEQPIAASLSELASAPNIYEGFRQWREGQSAKEVASEMVFGLSRPDVNIWNPVYPHLEKASAAIKRGSLMEARDHLSNAGIAVSKAHESITRFVEGSIKGAEHIVFGLEILKQAGSVAANAVWGPYGGAIYGGIQNFAQQGSEYWLADTRQELDWGSIGFDVLFNLITAGLGNKLGAAKQEALKGTGGVLGRLAPKLDVKNQLLRLLAKNPEMASLGKKAFAQAAQHIVSGRANSLLATAARTVFDKIRGKENISVEDFLERMVLELHPKSFLGDVFWGAAGHAAGSAVEAERASKQSKTAGTSSSPEISQDAVIQAPESEQGQSSGKTEPPVSEPPSTEQVALYQQMAMTAAQSQLPVSLPPEASKFLPAARAGPPAPDSLLTQVAGAPLENTTSVSEQHPVSLAGPGIKSGSRPSRTEVFADPQITDPQMEKMTYPGSSVLKPVKASSGQSSKAMPTPAPESLSHGQAVVGPAPEQQAQKAGGGGTTSRQIEEETSRSPESPQAVLPEKSLVQVSEPNSTDVLLGPSAQEQQWINQPGMEYGNVPEAQISAETTPAGPASAQTGFTRRNELTPEVMEANQQRNVPEHERETGSTGTARFGESETRAGEHLHEYNAAEIVLNLRTSYSPEHGGHMRWVEFDVPERVGNFGTRGDQFRQNERMRELDINTPAHEDFTKSNTERGHGAAQQLSGGDPDVAAILMQTDNVWPMTGLGSTGVNQGQYKQFEDNYIALKQSNPGATVRVRVEAVVGQSPKMVIGKNGRPILAPDAFDITVILTPPNGGLPQVQTLRIQN